jgi:hypothetical protein
MLLVPLSREGPCRRSQSSFVLTIEARREGRVSCPRSFDPGSALGKIAQREVGHAPRQRVPEPIATRTAERETLVFHQDLEGLDGLPTIQQIASVFMQMAVRRGTPLEAEKKRGESSTNGKWARAEQAGSRHAFSSARHRLSCGRRSRERTARPRGTTPLHAARREPPRIRSVARLAVARQEREANPSASASSCP